jgi:hypothetical protein
MFSEHPYNAEEVCAALDWAFCDPFWTTRLASGSVLRHQISTIMLRMRQSKAKEWIALNKAVSERVHSDLMGQTDEELRIKAFSFETQKYGIYFPALNRRVDFAQHPKDFQEQLFRELNVAYE